MGVIHHQKLVRDLIPEHLAKRGIQTETRILSEEEYLSCLLDKLVEEAKEALIAENETCLKEELADVKEVVRAILAATGISEAEIEAIRAKKRDERWGFVQRIFLEKTEE